MGHRIMYSWDPSAGLTSQMRKQQIPHSQHPKSLNPKSQNPYSWALYIGTYGALALQVSSAGHFRKQCSVPTMFDMLGSNKKKQKNKRSVAPWPQYQLVPSKSKQDRAASASLLSCSGLYGSPLCGVIHKASCVLLFRHAALPS